MDGAKKKKLVTIITFRPGRPKAVAIIAKKSG